MGNRLATGTSHEDNSSPSSPTFDENDIPNNFNEKYDDDEAMNDQQSAKFNDISVNEVEKSINISMHLKEKTIQSSPYNEKLLPMLVSLEVGDIEGVNKVPIDLVCVLDQSGSMHGEKIQLVKNTFNYLFKYLGDLDRLSIVTFNSDSSRLFPLVRTTKKNKEGLLKKINSIIADGGTNINLGMMRAFQILKERRQKNPVSSIFLLSDGLDNNIGAQERVYNSLKDYKIPDDVSINTFGFGKDHDPSLMTQVAQLRSGGFYYIEKLDTIDEMFIDCLGGLLSSVTQNVELTIKPEQSRFLNQIQIIKAYGDESLWEKNKDTYVTKLSRLISGRQRDFVLELKIPKNSKVLHDQEKKIKVASSEAVITTFDNKKVVKNGELYITLLNENEEIKEKEPNRKVMEHFYRLKTATLLHEARKLANKRDYNEAKKLLDDFKEELENCFMKNETFVKNLVTDINRAVRETRADVFDRGGHATICTMAGGHMYQQSNFATIGVYQNYGQERMIREVREMKGKK